MIINFKIFENVTEYPVEFVEAVNNTPGAEILPNGNIKLDISRYQKPEQYGGWSVRTGVFYLPELKSPYGSYYKNQKSYGGKEFVTGKTIVKKPYIIKAGTGGLGPEKAFIKIVGKQKFDEMISDIRGVLGFNQSLSLAYRSKYQMEEDVIEFLDKYDGDVDSAYDIVRWSNEGNRMRYALQEHIIAHTLRDAGYDSVLSYGKPRLSELFDLRQRQYPGETNFEFYDD